MRHEHDWRTGPVTDFTGRVQVICVDCLEVDKMSWKESKAWPKWTDADYERDSVRIEEKYG